MQIGMALKWYAPKMGLSEKKIGEQKTLFTG